MDSTTKKNIVFYAVVLVFILVLCAHAILTVAPYQEPPDTDMGIIMDFDVSAGGLFHDDLCTVETDQGKFSIDGYICSRLVSGHHLVKDGEYPSIWKVVEI